MFNSKTLTRIVRKSTGNKPVYGDDPVSQARQKRDELVLSILEDMPTSAQRAISLSYLQAAENNARY